MNISRSSSGSLSTGRLGLPGPLFGGRCCVLVIVGDVSSSQVAPPEENKTGRPRNHHAKQKAFH